MSPWDNNKKVMLAIIKRREDGVHPMHSSELNSGALRAGGGGSTREAPGMVYRVLTMNRFSLCGEQVNGLM